MHFVTLHSIKSFAQNEAGATAIEYVLIAAAMGFALIASAPFLATSVKGKFISVAGFFSLI
jgi:Flp pilus assembly pilin Flp